MDKKRHAALSAFEFTQFKMFLRGEKNTTCRKCMLFYQDADWKNRSPTSLNTVKVINISSWSWIDRKKQNKLMDQTEIKEQTEPNVNSCPFRKNSQRLTWIKLVVAKVFRCLKCNCNTSENGFHKKCVASSFQRSINIYFQVNV